MNFIQQLPHWRGQLSGLLWGNPLTLVILLGTGLYLTIRMGLVQVRGFTHAAALIFQKTAAKLEHVDPEFLGNALTTTGQPQAPA